ncbi:MAG TPA: aminotransferase class I/II-fold pyridoxal phosphate-dependent enzyme [Cytophagales bacterium]|nr:aminotransferase class I/II-fold pyridoxal phosphate-dependent enzyme [Cytophagales bacterium]
MENISVESICIHSGTSNANGTSGVNTPIYASSSFHYRDTQENIYPRYFNTINQNAIVEKLCALEGTEDGLVMSSGMAAISTTLLSLLKPSDHAVFFNEIYGGTYNLVISEFSKLGIEYTFVDLNQPGALENAIKENTKLIYVESPSNPLLTIVDIKAIARTAKDRNLLTVIDNTFASPINQNPVRLGIDVVVHSGTKYLGGHSDLCFGAILTTKILKESILKSALNFGGSINALDSYLIERSLKTLALRVERQSENAQLIAEFLERTSKVKKVYYPGLPTHENHAVAKEQMKGFGGMLSFEIASSNLQEVNRFLDNLQLIQPALSLGGVETIICSPVLTSHIKVPKEERERVGITDGLLRLSVGAENVKDLIVDLKQALEKL